MRNRQLIIAMRNRCIPMVLVAIALAAAPCASVSAQNPVQPAQRPAERPATERPAAGPDATEDRLWQDTRRAFEQWLSVQQIYTDAQIEQRLNALQRRVAGMNDAERVAFLRDAQARLAVLNGEEARQARAWVGETMSRLTPAGQQRFGPQLPDVANMTESQLQQSLVEQRLQVQQRQRNQAAAAQLRAQQNQLAMQMNQERQSAFREARQRQQSAVSGQATDRVQQGFQQSQQNARNHSFYAPGAFDPLINPYIWTNPWVW